ncbi:hypothetical protein FNV43_RR12679 [Rhamnella rubrinervis]|uniref:C3H1-type domain-containing protein n=1 Tax=Rhamnella rubrinervis TaxID=2594499 RepID=A0A8K0H8U8_9ROSA|nr:hypothetical protein FNV43_RR12679 [Rhamnella rubrinervis]
MMLGEPTRFNPTVQIPPWDPYEDQTAGMVSPFSIANSSVNTNSNAGGGDYSLFLDSFSSLHRYLPSNEFVASESDSLSEESDVPADAFSCDHFRMFEFKVRRCARGRSHDWTECPFAHPGEKARRRDPRKHHYSGTACPDFRKGNCKKGDSCEFAHGVFECWLHPARYRTQPCKDGLGCRRRVCFLLTHRSNFVSCLSRVRGLMGPGSFVSSPTSILTSPPVSPPSDSPPMSPSSTQPGCGSANSSSAWKDENEFSFMGVQMGSGFSSPRGGSALRPGFCSLPSTPTPRTPTRSGLSSFDLWDPSFEEEPAMERVESGKNLRAKMYAKLSKENSLDQVDSATSAPDVGWISELVK